MRYTWMLILFLGSIAVGCCRTDPRPFSYSHEEVDERGHVTRTFWQNLTLEELKQVRKECGQ